MFKNARPYALVQQQGLIGYGSLRNARQLARLTQQSVDVFAAEGFSEKEVSMTEDYKGIVHYKRNRLTKTLYSQGWYAKSGLARLF